MLKEMYASQNSVRTYKVKLKDVGEKRTNVTDASIATTMTEEAITQRITDKLEQKLQSEFRRLLPTEQSHAEIQKKTFMQSTKSSSNRVIKDPSPSASPTTSPKRTRTKSGIFSKMSNTISQINPNQVEKKMGHSRTSSKISNNT